MSSDLSTRLAAWQLREWDSAFFGTRIAQVATGRMAPAELARVVGDADAAGIDCLYFLADAADPDTVHAAERNGFSLVDVRLTLERELAPPGGESSFAAGAHGRGASSTRETTVDARDDAGAMAGERATVRVARAADLPALEALARTSHRNTRFYRDARFDPDRCDELYAVWIERSVAGELADVVWVVDVEGVPRGYLTVKVNPLAPAEDVSATTRSSTIGLVAIDPVYRGRGFGDALLRRACEWTAERGLTRATVVTQGNNAAAIRFYQRAGFVASRVELWYHRWRHTKC